MSELPISGINPLTDIDVRAAWDRLSPEVQADLGVMLIEQVLASFVFGDLMPPEVTYCSREIREAACEREDAIFGTIYGRVWAALPEIFGPDDCDPPWAWRETGSVSEAGFEPPGHDPP